MKFNFNEQAAMQFVFQFISVEELLQAASIGFSETETVKSQENSDICFKALSAFLK